MHVPGIARRLLGVHEAEVVVAVHGLADTAGTDEVGLSGHLIARAQPGVRAERDHVVLVVLDERLGILNRELLQRIPDPVVGAGLAEVVTALAAGGLLIGDDLSVCVAHLVEDRPLERAGDDDDAGAVGPGVAQLGLDARERAIRNRLPQARRLVDDDTLLDPARMRVVGEVGLLLEDREQVIELAVLGAEPVPCAGGGGHHLPHRSLAVLLQDRALRAWCHPDLALRNHSVGAARLVDGWPSVGYRAR